jgi:hypothetical protein
MTVIPKMGMNKIPTAILFPMKGNPFYSPLSKMGCPGEKQKAIKTRTSLNKTII